MTAVYWVYGFERVNEIHFVHGDVRFEFSYVKNSDAFNEVKNKLDPFYNSSSIFGGVAVGARFINARRLENVADIYFYIDDYRLFGAGLYFIDDIDRALIGSCFKLCR